jgi:hypothetical protein
MRWVTQASIDAACHLPPFVGVVATEVPTERATSRTTPEAPARGCPPPISPSSPCRPWHYRAIRTSEAPPEVCPFFDGMSLF